LKTTRLLIVYIDMETTGLSVAERMAIDNGFRKQTAGRLGAALIMVPLVLGLVIFWLVMVGLYVESVAWYDEPEWSQIRWDARHFIRGPVYAYLMVHLILILTAWYAGRQAGIHVLHHGRRAFPFGIMVLFLAVLPALLLFFPLWFGFTRGFDEVIAMIAWNNGKHVLVVFDFALVNAVLALVLGSFYGWLLWRAKQRQGKVLRKEEVSGAVIAEVPVVSPSMGSGR
jgi:hypothetical protein